MDGLVRRRAGRWYVTLVVGWVGGWVGVWVGR